MPLSLLALLGMAIFVWMERGDFSTREVSFYIEGPSQIENGKSEKFSLIVENNSTEELEDLNLSLEVPESLRISGGREAVDAGFGNVLPGGKESIEFYLTASSMKTTETINARVDYSPRGVSARFVALAVKEIIIGSFDVSLDINLPQQVYVGQEIQGQINLRVNSDIEISPVFLRLNVPEGFEISYRSSDFYYDNVWQLGSLKEGQTIKREFRGTLASDSEFPIFSVELGVLSGVRFIPLNSAEATVQISETPIVLEHRLVSPADGDIKAGSRVEMEISYVNKSEFLVKDAKIITSLQAGGLIDFSTLDTDGDFDAEARTIEWNVANTPDLNFVDIDESGSVYISFNIVGNLVPKSATDTNKSIFVESIFDSTVLDDKALRATGSINIRISTELKLQQSVYRSGGQFSQEGPHPPQADTLSTYTVRWVLTNTMNQTRSVKIEAALPQYAVWIGQSSVSGGEIRYFSDTNTVVWTMSSANVGLGYVFPYEQVDFQVGIEPPTISAKGPNTVLITQTKLTGTDAFTGLFLEQGFGETTVSN